MTRQTKIVATLGPASSDPQILARMVQAGVDVVRMNFSYGKASDHIARAEAIRKAAANAGRPIGILADLQGPKIRVGMVTVYNFLIPVFGALLSAIFLGEDILQWRNALALAMVSAGIWWVTTEKTPSLTVASAPIQQPQTTRKTGGPSH